MRKGKMLAVESCPHCGDYRDLSENENKTIRCQHCGEDFLPNTLEENQQLHLVKEEK